MATPRPDRFGTSRARTRASPIVALTANAMTGQFEQCVEAGMDALLTKPLNVERLEEALVRFGLLVSSGSPDFTS
jgi:CheY-like chemotaxis protein